MIERYLVEELLGACMTFSYGNLFSDPVSRIVFNMAMDAGNTKGVPGTMTFGNTIDYGLDLSRNYGALSSFSLADAVCQRHKPTGHAAPCPFRKHSASPRRMRSSTRICAST